MASCPVNTVLSNAALNGFLNSAQAPLLTAELLAECVKALSPGTDVRATAVLARAATNGLLPGTDPKELSIITAQNLCDCIAAV